MALFRCGKGSDGLKKEQFLENWISVIGSLKNVGSECWYRYPSNNHYLGLISSDFLMNIGILSSKINRGQLTAVRIKNNYSGFLSGYINNSYNNALAQNGREIFYPIDSSEGTVIQLLDNSSTDSNSVTLFNMDSEFTSLNAGSHPFFIDNWGNGQKISILDALLQAKPCDFFSISGYANPVGAYMIWANNTYYICITTDTGDNAYYNINDGKIYRNKLGRQAYAVQFSGRGLKTAIESISVYSDTGAGSAGIACSLSEIGQYIPFSTFDIKDENGNVLLAANCNLSDLGIF